MNLLAVEIDAICIALLLLIFFTYPRAYALKSQGIAFRFVLAWFVVFSAVDMTGMLFPPESVAAIQVLVCLKIVTCSCIGISWFVYVNLKSRDSLYWIRKWLVLVCFPFLLVIMFAIINACMHLGDETVYYNRTLWILFNIVSVGYIVSASIVAVRRSHACRNAFSRTLYNYLACIMLFPVLFMALQSKFMDLIITSPVMALTLLHFYITNLKLQITEDPATGVYNVQKLSMYLDSVTESLAAGKRLFYVQVALDNQKLISKKFGRDKSDFIMQRLGAYIRGECNSENVFLARPREDRFAIVIETESFGDVERLARNIIERHDDSVYREIIPWKVSFNIYWSEFGPEGSRSVDELILRVQENCIKPPTLIPRR